MRNTKQKQLIFDIINNNYNHLTAKETFIEAKKTINNISLSTVYRILNSLVDDNKILRITTKFGIDHFDRIPPIRHSHFICDKCMKITDVFNSKYSYDINELNGYIINDVEIIFSGICNECMKGKK